MRISLTLGAAAAVLVACVFPACSSSTNGPAIDTDAGTSSGTSGTSSGTSGSTDGGSSSGEGGSGDCAGADPGKVDALSKMLGGWHWSKEIVNGKEEDLTGCELGVGYFIGPDIAKPDYPKCAIARQEVIPLRGGRYATPGTCSELACSKLGLLVMNDKAAGVYALDDNGNTKGTVAFYFTLDGGSLIQSNTATILTNGNRLTVSAGVPSCK